MVKRDLETDRAGAVELASEKHACTAQTIRNTAHRVGGLIKPDSGVIMDEQACLRRVQFADARLGKNHQKTCWVDHTYLDIPPRRLTAAVWRADDSKKHVPFLPRYKKRTSMQMYLAAGICGFATPTFSAERVRCKRRRTGESELGYRWETH